MVSNVLLFIPWGFLLAIWLAGRGRRYLLTLTLALLSGALLSGTVEFVQLFAPSRYTSFVDLVTNTFGSMRGAFIGWPAARLDLADRVGPDPAVARFASADGVCPGCRGRSGDRRCLSPFDVEPELRATWKPPSRPRGRFRLDRRFGGRRRRRSLGHGRASCSPGCWPAAFSHWRRGNRAIAARGAIGWAVRAGRQPEPCHQAIQLVIPGRDVDMTSVVLALAGSALGCGAGGPLPPGTHAAGSCRPS